MDSIKLRAARKKAGLTQESLASALGVNRATISKYESGLIEPPVSQIKQIAKILGIMWYELYPDSQQEEAILEDVEEMMNTHKHWQRLPYTEMHREGAIHFNSVEDQISFFYRLLNTEGKLAASLCFKEHLNPESLTEVADCVENLYETPQYQSLNPPVHFPGHMLVPDDSEDK